MRLLRLGYVFTGEYTHQQNFAQDLLLVESELDCFMRLSIEEIAVTDPSMFRQALSARLDDDMTFSQLQFKLLY